MTSNVTTDEMAVALAEAATTARQAQLEATEERLRQRIQIVVSESEASQAGLTVPGFADGTLLSADWLTMQQQRADLLRRRRELLIQFGVALDAWQDRLETVQELVVLREQQRSSAGKLAAGRAASGRKITGDNPRIGTAL